MPLMDQFPTVVVLLSMLADSDIHSDIHDWTSCVLCTLQLYHELSIVCILYHIKCSQT